MSPSRFRVRGIFRGAVKRVAAPFIRAGVRPDTITYTTLFFAFLGMLTLLLTGSEPLFGLLVFLVGFFDGVDGAVARGSGRTSSAGAFTDSTIDKAAETILILSIVVVFYGDLLLGIPVAFWGIVCITSWILTSYTRARAEILGVKDLDVGIGGRSERLLTLSISSLLYCLLPGLVIVTFLGIGTASYRFYYYRLQLATTGQKG
jgi:CDP-diacylglycerol--glycerol-3-phosphate 3-phosphatidyltransferase